MSLFLTKFQRRILQLLVVVIVGFCFYKIASDIYTYQTTGVLTITSNTDHATISVSGQNTDAAFAGTGNGTVRLPEGRYLVYASDSNKRASSVVTITKKTQSHIELTLSAPKLPPSIYDVRFSGKDELIANGLTVGQITNLRQGLYNFNTAEQSVVITPGSVEPGPRNPNTDNDFVLNFIVAIDHTGYNASVKYGLGDTVRLTLVDQQTNETVYSKTVDTQL